MVTQEEYDELSSRQDKLEHSQERIIHILNTSLSILAHTQAEVDEHGEAINHLINTTTHLKKRVNDLQGWVKAADTEIMYNQILLEFQGIFHIIRGTLVSLVSCQLKVKDLRRLGLQVDCGKISKIGLNTLGIHSLSYRQKDV